MSRLTQRERILRHLEDWKSITRAEAMQEYGIANITARISELKAAGYPVKTNTVYGKNRYGEPIHWAKYTLEDTHDGIAQ